MDTLDFSALSDDQLVGLLRAVLRECAERGSGVYAAAREASIDEAERAQVANQAAEREAAKIRAQERERIAREAAEAVRRQHAEQEAAAQALAREAQRQRDVETAAQKAEAAKREAAEAVALATKRESERRGWLRRFASLVDCELGDIHVARAHTNKGWRVLVNKGDDKYTRDHLVDYYPATAVISTSRSLVSKKRDLIALCAEFWALNPKAETVYFGSSYDWSEETEAAHA